MIEIENMTKTFHTKYSDIEALKEVSLSVSDGEFVAIMGPSGSGKSTLLNAIGLINDFDGGEYILNGISIRGKSKKEQSRIRRDNISFIFQNYELMRNYTVYENIEIPLLAKNKKAKYRRGAINDVADNLDIAKYLSSYPYQLSGGQQQRVAIARAIVSGNPLLLADEPTGALDSENSRILMEYMLMLKDMKKTIIMVTHDEKVAAYSDRVLHLEDGTIV